MDGSSPIITNTCVTQCKRGVVSIDSVGLLIVDSCVSNNSGRGVLVYNDPSCEIKSSQIKENLGGFLFAQTLATIDQCKIVGNIAVNCCECTSDIQRISIDGM